MSNKYPGGIITSGANAGYSVAFDGTGDYLSVNNAAFNFSGTDFTIEFWLYNTGTTSDTMLLQWGSGAAGDIQFVVNQGGTSGAIALGTSGVAKTAASVSANNRWVYVAGVRSGTTYYTYVDGTRYTTQSSGTPSASTSFNIASGMTGYISNLRISNTARYTSTTMVVPNILQTDANTKLWTCLGSPIVDQSGNSYTITINGNAAVSTFTPFQGYVAYNPALGAATPGIWTVSDAIQAAQTRRWNMYDPYFNLTTLLLHGNYTGSVNSSGTAVYQNNNFLDSSSNNFTITRNGNPTQGTFSPFSQTGWGNFFDGSASYISAPNNAAFDFGSGNFTVEMWVYPTAAAPANGAYLYYKGTGGNFAPILIQQAASGYGINFLSSSAGTSWDLANTSFGTLTANAWNHIAICRSGSNAYCFLNGVLATTLTNWSTTAVKTDTNPLLIGYGNVANSSFSGYMSNLRVVKGTALYTSGFTPPTSPLTAITNTSLLTCQSNRFVDNSSNAFAITVGGTPSVQTFSPFYPLVAYTPQAQGGSGYFDGTDDYLSIANNTAFDFGSGDFTIELWWYPTTLTGNQNLTAKWWTGGSQWVLQWRGSTANQFKFTWNSSSSTSFTSGLPQLNAWNHIAVVRSGTSLYLYLNGTRNATVGSISGSLTATTDPFTIGQFGNLSSEYLTGYLSSVRITKGGALYTASTITVPTSPLTTSVSSGTVSALLSYTNAGITDATAKNNLETVGNAQISTTQSKFGGGSISFNGTNSVLRLPNNAMLSLSGGNYTIEFWLYLNSVTGIQVLVERFTAPSGPGYTLYMNGTAVELYGSSVVFSSGTLATGQWYHIAVSKSGSTTYLFINGTQSTSTTNNIGDAAEPVYVGARSGTGSYLNGFIDDLRITKGYARYTANFTPQTSQWQDQ